LARRWMQMIKRDTGNNPVLFSKLNAMHETEPSLAAATGISADMMHFVIAAAQEARNALYRPYLDEDEFAFLRANIGKRAMEWRPLIAQVYQAMQDGHAPDSPVAQALARHWFDLFRSYAGDKPETQLKIRKALAEQPELTDDGMVDAPMRDYIRAAMQSLAPRPSANA